MPVAQNWYNRRTINPLLVLVFLLFCDTTARAQDTFTLKMDSGAIVSLRRVNDTFPTEYIQNNRRLGDVFLRYRGKDGAWQSIDTAKLATDGQFKLESSADG